jgi:hypothetical protein
MRSALLGDLSSLSLASVLLYLDPTADSRSGFINGLSFVRGLLSFKSRWLAAASRWIQIRNDPLTAWIKLYRISQPSRLRTECALNLSRSLCYWESLVLKLTDRNGFVSSFPRYLLLLGGLLIGIYWPCQITLSGYFPDTSPRDFSFHVSNDLVWLRWSYQLYEFMVQSRLFY